MRENFYNTRTPQSLFVALNYLSKNENIKFTIADSTLTVSDDKIICPNGKTASLTYSLKREEWKDIPVETDQTIQTIASLRQKIKKLRMMPNTLHRTELFNFTLQSTESD